MLPGRTVLVLVITAALALPLLLATSPTEGLRIEPDSSLADSFASFSGLGGVGHAVSGAGDVNGDGLQDFLIGAPLDDDGGETAGKTYLVLGRTSGWAMGTNLSTADASFLGENSGDRSGWAVSGAGDVNGDGNDDVLIGAPYNDEGGSAAGQVYLILGKASGWTVDTDLSEADASFLGEGFGDLSGYAVSGAGDVNGDGFDDFLIGAYLDDDNGGDAGQTYLVLGKASGWAMDTRLGSVDASFRGEAETDYSGYAVSGAGDVNGDGFDDFLIGAYGNGEGAVLAGQTYLILGRASGWAMDTDLADADASFLGEGRIEDSGRAVAGAGDINGDGFDDFLIGALFGPLGDATGKTYLVLGNETGWAMDTGLTNADTCFWGEHAEDFSGCAVAGAGDVNGDGCDDILIAARHNDDGGTDAGQTYLVLGKASGWATDVDLANADATFWGEGQDDLSGWAVAGAGDVNGDGADDFIISAFGKGLTYLLSFDATLPEFLEDSTPSQATAGDAFNFTVSVLDTSGVEDVSVEFWFGDDADHVNRSMVLSSGDRWMGTWDLGITIPPDSLEPLHYVVSAVDGAGNLNRTEERLVTVVNANDPPVIVEYYPDPLWILNETEDGFTLFSVEAEDPDGDVLTITWYVDGDEVARGEEYRFGYDYFSAGDYRVEVVVSDGTDEARRTWRVVIYNVNRPPVLANVTPEPPCFIYEEEGGVLNFSVEAVDPDHDPMTFLWSLDGANLTEVTGPVYQFQYDHDSAGPYQVALRVNDTMDEVLVEWYLVVKDVNRPPRILYAVTVDLWVEEVEGGSVPFAVEAMDPDGDEVLYEWYVDGTRLEGETNKSYPFPIGFDSAGVHNVTVVVDDRMSCDSHTWLLHVNDTNRPPLIEAAYPRGGVTVNVSEDVTLAVTARDPDAGDVLGYRWYLDGAAIEGATGTVHTLIPDEAGTLNVTVEVLDGEGASATHRWSVTVVEPDVGGPGRDDGWGVWWIAIVVIVLAVAGTAIAVAMRRS